MILYDHVACNLSALDLEMIGHVPPGGNWTNIPVTVPSKRLDQIRQMARDRGGVVRTTYYGRLREDAPAYTVSTYFNRPGNGCNIHYRQDRTLSIREAARIQSFPDKVQFIGSQSARRKQVGNAVPVLLAAAVGRQLPRGTVVDLFAGAGGLSMGFALAGHEIQLLADNDPKSIQVAAAQHLDARVMTDDLTESGLAARILSSTGSPDIVIGGPPCQGWSFAGWYQETDKRNDLIWCFLDFVARLSPRHFVMENVEGLRSLGGGAALGGFTDQAEKLGFSVAHFVLNAASYGVPQRRKRLFVVGTTERVSVNPPDPLFSKEDLFLPNPITVGDAISDLPELDPGGGDDEVDWVPPEPAGAYQRWIRGDSDLVQFYSAYGISEELGNAFTV